MPYVDNRIEFLQKTLPKKLAKVTTLEKAEALILKTALKMGRLKLQRNVIYQQNVEGLDEFSKEFAT